MSSRKNLVEASSRVLLGGSVVVGRMLVRVRELRSWRLKRIERFLGDRVLSVISPPFVGTRRESMIHTRPVV
jgi:hypothetical protein